jgi:hypothetical protein
VPRDSIRRSFRYIYGHMLRFLKSIAARIDRAFSAIVLRMIMSLIGLASGHCGVAKCKWVISTYHRCRTV